MVFNEQDLIERMWLFLKDARQNGKMTMLILTGGHTVKRFYLNPEWKNACIEFDMITFADERLVPINSHNSNAGNLVRMIPEVEPKFLLPNTPEGDISLENQSIISAILNDNNWRTLCLSGFGLDGHIWSLFEYENLLNDNLFLTTHSDYHENKRVTLGRQAIELIDTHLLFSTTEKWRKLLDKFERAPLIHLLQDVYLL